MSQVDIHLCINAFVHLFLDVAVCAHYYVVSD